MPNKELDPRVAKEAQALIDGGWYQTSRAYCMLAKLPKGKTGMQSLIETKEWDSANVARMGEHGAGEQFLRVYAKGTLKKSVSSHVMDAFKRLGGGTYAQSRLPPMLRQVRELSRELESSRRTNPSYDLGISKGWADALELFTRLFEHSDFKMEADHATRFSEEAMLNIDSRGRAAVALGGQDLNLQGADHEQESGRAVLPVRPDDDVPVSVSEERGSGDQPE